MRDSNPNASLIHGAGSYHPATRITIQASGRRDRDTQVLYETIVPNPGNQRACGLKELRGEEWDALALSSAVAGWSIVVCNG